MSQKTSIVITKSPNKQKKWKAEFYKGDKRIKTTHFGAAGYEDYTMHKDKTRRASYRARHAGDNLRDKFSAGALSYYVLWNTPSFKKNVELYKKRFSLV